MSKNTNTGCACVKCNQAACACGSKASGVAGGCQCGPSCACPEPCACNGCACCSKKS